MKIVASWLRDFCVWDWPVEVWVEKLTMSGTEVEAVERTGFHRDGFVVARVESFVPHPNADRLRLCRVFDGSMERQIVCGASNFSIGDHVVLALPGAVMPAGFTIKESKLRGELSQGMMCAASELELPAPEGESGLMLLDSSVQPGTPLRDWIQGDVVLDCEVTPNRPDLLSYRGLAREMIALGARENDFRSPNPIPCASKHPDWSVVVDNPLDCPRYTLTYFDQVKVGPSPEWMRNRLIAAGVRPINNVVDITNYVLLETGQPLHAFDAALLHGKEIRVRRATSGESLLALDGQNYALTDGDLVIADASGPVALAGVMGGEGTGVTEKTLRVVLESARFAPSVVRATSKRLGLSSDSSYRFERGIDPTAVQRAVARTVELMKELTGAKVLGATLESCPLEHSPIEVSLRSERVRTILGRPVETKRITEILQALGCVPLSSESDEARRWTMPSSRLDLRREIDLIEELARFEGLDSIQSEMSPGVAAWSKADERYDAETRLRQTLTGLGFTEAMTGSLVPEGGDKEGGVQLSNPLVSDAARLRTDLLESLLPSVRINLGQGTTDLKLFEAGTVYQQHKGRAVEKRHLLLLATGKVRADHWTGTEREFNYFDMKGLVEWIESEFHGITALSKDGAAGLVSTAELKQHGIKVPLWFAAWDISKMAMPARRSFKPLPQYPGVKRDLAFVVNRSMPSAALEQAIR
ncbi:MAG: phenylalanine--tRNA ligase subunit beta, partial [Candidatus Methylacidiphilales bacterium]